MDAFRFSPELFGIRTEVMEALEQAGFQWLSHYSAVDCLHDLYGVEVCGIHEKEDAATIQEILVEMFPGWHVGCRCYKDRGRDPGWKVQIYRDKPRRREQWETA
jgi:hypothetical protein